MSTLRVVLGKIKVATFIAKNGTVYPDEATRRAAILGTLKEIFAEASGVPAAIAAYRATLLGIGVVGVDGADWTWPTTAVTTAAVQRKCAANWLALVSVLELVDFSVESANAATSPVTPAHGPTTPPLDPNSGGPPDAAPRMGEPPAKRVCFDPAALYGGGLPTARTPATLTMQNLHSNANLSTRASSVINGNSAPGGAPLASGGAPDYTRYKVDVNRFGEEKFLGITADGTLKPTKEKRASPSSFVEHVLRFVTDESIPLEERDAMGAFTREAFRWKETHPWWCVYDFYLEALTMVKKGDIISIDPRYCAYLFHSRYAAWTGGGENNLQTLSEGGGGGGGQGGGGGNRGGGSKGQPGGKGSKGMPLCFQFNDARGNVCKFDDCKFEHKCSVCGSSKHSKSECKQRKKG